MWFRIKLFFSNLKARWQRFIRGYADEDVWSIDWWFLHNVPRMLDDLANDTMGIPRFNIS